MSNSSNAPSPREAYHDLRRLIPPLAAELDYLRASLREHNLWLQRYGHNNETPPAPDVSLSGQPGPRGPEMAAADNAQPPAYSSHDLPPYGGVREEVSQRRDQLYEWLKEGEDLLRDYSTRFAQLAGELQLPAEDLLGTWQEAAPDNALPDYMTVEEREDLMVGGVGEVPPPYTGGAVHRQR